MPLLKYITSRTVGIVVLVVVIDIRNGRTTHGFCSSFDTFLTQENKLRRRSSFSYHGSINIEEEEEEGSYHIHRSINRSTGSATTGRADRHKWIPVR